MVFKRIIRRILNRKTVFYSGEYWENRYAHGGNSGDGSYGRLATFKSDIINDFKKENKIESAIEFGCGDGNQLSQIEFTKYLGLDVSANVIKKNGELFKNDNTKSFMVYKTEAFFNKNFIKADLTLSLDVIYHLSEEAVYKKYLQDLFDAASRFVIVYSTNFNKPEEDYIVHREFTSFIEQAIPGFELIKEIKNPYPGIGEQESLANFYIFKRK